MYVGTIQSEEDDLKYLRDQVLNIKTNDSLATHQWFFNQNVDESDLSDLTDINANAFVLSQGDHKIELTIDDDGTLVIGGNVKINGDAIIKGDLTVCGTTTVYEVNTIRTDDWWKAEIPSNDINLDLDYDWWEHN